MTTVAQWLAAPLPVVERGEREAFARGLYDQELDAPSACNCGVLAACRYHRLQSERWEAEQRERLNRSS